MNYEAEKLLVKKLRVGGTFPAVVGVVDGRLRWFTNAFELQNLRDFVRSLFPSDLILTVGSFTELHYWLSYVVGRGGALVEAITFNRRVVGSTPALAATQGPWASPLPTVACALRRETLIQYPCCSRERL